MKKFSKIKRKDISPGEFIYVGPARNIPTTMQLFSYNESNFIEENPYILNDNLFIQNSINWLNIHGIQNVVLIKEIANKIGLNSLNLQDLLNTHERPKIEENENYIFFTTKSISSDVEKEFSSEQITFVLGNNFIVSFQEKPASLYEHIRLRIRNNLGIVRKKRADYLLFLLLDAIIDNYYVAMDKIADKIAKLEEKVLNNPEDNFLIQVEKVKNEVNFIKSQVQPLKDSVIRLDKVNPKFIDSNNTPYFSDLKDSTLSLLDYLEQSKNSLNGITNIYLSTLSNKMNSTMKLLTVISTIFIPLTFIVGVYGMNFDYMPELKYHYGYPIAMITMLLISVGMAIYFKKKKFL